MTWRNLYHRLFRVDFGLQQSIASEVEITAEKEYVAMRSLKKTTNVLFPLVLLTLLAIGLTACGATSSNTGGSSTGAAANEVDMGVINFVQSSVTIDKGQSIHFVDQQSGAMHILCVGKDGHCEASANAPKALAGSGFTIQPGQSHDVRFDSIGVYAVTCTLHPTMNLTITVR